MNRYSLFRRLVSLLLAVLVLAASVGLTVQRQTCRLSGRSKVDVLVAGMAAAGNCGGQLAPARSFVKDNCCDVSSHLHQLTAPSQELAAKVLVPAPLLAVWLPEATWARVPVVDDAEARALRWFAADASPPPRGGRGLLAFVCTMVV